MTLTILVGTTKGAFLIDGESHAVRGPFCDGWPINHIVGDRESGHLFAAGGNDFFGAGVFRSTDGGETWTDKRSGLPQDACFFTVLRQAMAVDRGDPAGVYFGTNTGSIFASADEGETWDEVARHLPTVLSVEVLDRR